MLQFCGARAASVASPADAAATRNARAAAVARRARACRTAGNTDGRIATSARGRSTLPRSRSRHPSPARGRGRRAPAGAHRPPLHRAPRGSGTTRAAGPSPTVATVPFAPLTAITSGQIQRSTSPNFGDLFFTTPGATSPTFAPGASRPILRGLGDFRVRMQENGVGTGDVSDWARTTRVPIDPLAVQKIEIFRGPAALRFGSQAVGGVVEAINNRIPTAAPLGGVAAELKGGRHHGRQRVGERSAARRRLAQCRHPRRLLRPPRRRLSHPELSLSVSARSGAGRRTAGSRTRAFHTEGASGRAARGCSTAAMPASRSAASPATIKSRASRRRRRRAHIGLEQTKITSKGEFRPHSSAVAAVRYWAGYTDYKHDELGRTTPASSRSPARSSTGKRRARSRSSRCR